MRAPPPRMERFIDDALDAIEQAPEMWGGAESIESQYLLLLQLRTVALRPHADDEQIRSVRDAYDRFVGRHVPAASPAPLAQLLERDGRPAELMDLLGRFRQELLGEILPENPFDVYDVALALRLRKGSLVPSASRIGAYYDTVTRVMRGVARRGTGHGRLKRDLEDAITLRPAAGFEIVPPNGVGGQVVMPLEWPGSTQRAIPGTPTLDDEVQNAFAHFLTVAEWAAAKDEPFAELAHALPDAGARTRFALEAMRLVPRQDTAIEAVEIGGRAIMRTKPVTLSPAVHGRLLTVVESGRSAQSFEGTGVIRAADLDLGKFRLKLGEGASRVVWLQDAELTERAATVLGRGVRVVGQEYTQPSRAPFVVASGLEALETDEAGEDE